MEINCGLDVADLPGAEPSPVVAAFLQTVRDEQERFVEALRRAQSMLRQESGQLGQLTAIHTRLTQQFLDGQRAILARRAGLDAEVAAIVNAVEPVASRSGWTRTQARVATRPTGHEIADLGTAVVRTVAEAEALRDVIDDAFGRFEYDGTGRQKELTALLDSWWTAEADQRCAALDDADARAVVRRHLAAIVTRAGEVDNSQDACTHDDRKMARATALPEDVLAVFEAVDASGLDGVFSGLVKTLGAASVAPSGCDVLPGDEFFVAVPAAVFPGAPCDASAEAQVFWPPKHSRFRALPKRNVGAARLEIVLSMCAAAASVVALVATWAA